ncbi:MAG: YihY/virulence factor BrkB family protein [Sinomicrobium sp.]|nr:YihY/virulence factor BrkB family protein [Sinomicrobium sp.]
MSKLKQKILKLPFIKHLVEFLKRTKPRSFQGLSLYRVLDMYITGIIKGALAYRASAISFSFFMAIFPFLLFILNLIPYVPIEGFQKEFQGFLENLLPPQTASFIDPVFEDIANNRRGGLLSSVFILSIFLMANGINAIFGGFETSYHVEISRNVVKQYLVAIGVAIIIAILLIITVTAFIYFEIYVIQNLNDYGYIENDEIGVLVGQYIFLVVIIYLVTAILYYFGTAHGRESKFFSPGALLSTVLIIITTYLFGVYIENFSNYNEIYGSIGALLILMLYIWLNSNILLLGFELNASITRLKRKS